MRWRFLAIACSTALILSLAISFLMTREYTATVSIVIDPPASSDPRAGTAISPIYLESLRTYEYYAEGDALFAQAVARFHLRTKEGQAVESLKRKILRVTKPKDSKILQIRATLPDPDKAVGVAQFIASEVVKLSHQAGAEIDSEMRRAAEQDLQTWRGKRQEAMDATAGAQALVQVETLRGEVDSLQELMAGALRNAMEAEADAEYYGAREKLLSGDGSDADELRRCRQEAIANRTRASALRRQAHDLQSSVTAKDMELAKHISARARLDTDMKIAETGLEAEEKHVRDLQDAVGGRGEVLTIIDPGITPQRPSSPNILLNVIVALFAALVISLLYLVLAFGLSRTRIWEGRG